MGTVERRLELLKMEGLGFSQAEIVKELSQKHECSDRTVYYDFECRKEWQPVLQQLSSHDAILMKIVNRYEQIYRQASVKLLTATQEIVQIGALNVMLKVNERVCELRFCLKFSIVILRFLWMRRRLIGLKGWVRLIILRWMAL